MFKKTVKLLDTAADRRVKNLSRQLSDARCQIESAVENCIIKNGVINLYPPESPDREKASKDAKNARMRLLNNIAQYDNLMVQYSNALSNSEERKTTINWTNNHSDSHKLVEIAYKNFYKNS